MAEERWAIHVDGIALPGYDSYEEAQSRIDRDPDLKARGAVAVQLTGARRIRWEERFSSPRTSGRTDRELP